MFSVFGEGALDVINTNATSAEITAWKHSAKTLACYKNLCKTPDGKDLSIMARILDKVWPKSNASEEQLSFTISICQTILDPVNEIIQINEGVLKSIIQKNKVSF
jgi:hypothetical protein